MPDKLIDTSRRSFVKWTSRLLAPAAIVLLLLPMFMAPVAYGQTSSPQPETQAQEAPKPSPETPGAPETAAVVIDDQGVSSLLGMDVGNASDDKIGRIVDVLVSRQGELRAVVIDFGGFLGVGTRRVAIDWKALAFKPDGTVSVRMTSDELRVTPEFRSGQPVVVVGPAEAKQNEANDPADPGGPPSQQAPEPKK